MPSDAIKKLAYELKTLGSVRRLEILSFIKRKKSATVGDIAETLDISQESVSQHLRVLRLSGIVTANRRGKNVSYRIMLGQKGIVKGVIGGL